MVRIIPKVYFKHGLWWMINGVWRGENRKTKMWVEQANIRLRMREKQKLSDWENAQHWLRHNLPSTVDVIYQGVKRTLPIDRKSSYLITENAIRQAKQPGPWEQRMVMGNCS